MNGRTWIAGVIGAWAVAGLVVAAPQAMAKGKDSKAVARGRYLVEQVGMCADCHSPRNEKGQFIQERWLQGAPLDFKPTVPIPGWAEAAPPLAGLPGWTEAEVVTLLTTGKDPKGGMAGPPMPQYRMTKEDAAAVAAYLASLGAVAKK